LGSEHSEEGFCDVLRRWDTLLTDWEVLNAGDEEDDVRAVLVRVGAETRTAPVVREGNEPGNIGGGDVGLVHKYSSGRIGQYRSFPYRIFSMRHLLELLFLWCIKLLYSVLGARGKQRKDPFLWVDGRWKVLCDYGDDFIGYVDAEDDLGQDVTEELEEFAGPKKDFFRSAITLSSILPGTDWIRLVMADGRIVWVGIDQPVYATMIAEAKKIESTK
jgi:hypothetical protein